MKLQMVFTKERRLAVLAALGTFLVMLVATLTDRVFEPGYQPWSLVVVPIVPLVLAIALARFRWPLRVAVQAVVGLALVAFVIERHHGDLPGDFIGGLRHGASSIFGTRWPAPTDTRAVALIAFAVVLAAVLVVELAVSGKFSSGILLPPGVLLALVALSAARAGMPPPRFLVLFTLACLAILRLASLTRHELPHHAKGSAQDVERRSVLTMAIVGMTAVSVGILPALLAGAISNNDRFDPRDRIRSHEQVEDELSPLSRVDIWKQADPAREMFRTSSTVTRRWRLTTLNRYDGRSWMPPADYQIAGTRIQAPDPRGSDVETIDVTWGELDIRWLPSIDRTRSIDRRVKVDPGLGGYLVSDVPASKDIYRVMAQPVVAPDQAQLKGTFAGQDLSGLVNGVKIPQSIIDLASNTVASAQTDYERADALKNLLLNKYLLDSKAPSGHSLGGLELFLENSKAGRAEQFVAAYGLLAAAVGLPVRIAVGFNTVAAPDGLGTVAMSSGATAWPEVELVGFGWVPLNVVPDEKPDTAGLGNRVVNQAPVEAGQPPPTTASPPPTTVDPKTKSSIASNATGTVPSGAKKVIAGFVFLLLALATYVAVVLRMKTGRRRRRLEDPDLERRATGAFRTSVDTLIDLGGRAPVTKTDRELVAVGAQVLPHQPDALKHLAAIATQVVYDGPEPDEQIGSDAWDKVDAFETDARTGISRWRWFRARVSLRSLRRGLPD